MAGGLAGGRGSGAQQNCPSQAPLSALAANEATFKLGDKMKRRKTIMDCKWCGNKITQGIDDGQIVTKGWYHEENWRQKCADGVHDAEPKPQGETTANELS